MSSPGFGGSDSSSGSCRQESWGQRPPRDRGAPHSRMPADRASYLAVVNPVSMRLPGTEPWATAPGSKALLGGRRWLSKNTSLQGKTLQERGGVNFGSAVVVCVYIRVFQNTRGK